MKYLDEYRSQREVKTIARQIKAKLSQAWTLMEVCGGQTHAIARFGLEQLLPPEIEIVHGPGCPVCVTPLRTIDAAIELASRPGIILCSFGDMLRVPGSDKSLGQVRATGGELRVVYSPLDALVIAQDNPSREVVFLAVGFETTAPANAMAVYQAHDQGIRNFSILTSHYLVPPAIAAICDSPASRVDAFLAAGHVCSIMGYWQYLQVVEQYQVPVVVTGFEPLDIMQGILLSIQQLEEGRCEVENQYSRAVRKDGNTSAQTMINKVFEIKDQNWRGIGRIPESGLQLRHEFSAYDAWTKHACDLYRGPEESDRGCISGQILQGLKKPEQCPHFGRSCRPENPLGAPMVSSEGACAAYYRYRHKKQKSHVTDSENIRIS